MGFARGKLLRWFLIAACLLNLIGGFVVAQEGKFWKWAPSDRRDVPTITGTKPGMAALPTRPAGAGYAASPIGTAAPNEWPTEAALAIVGLLCAMSRASMDEAHFKEN